MDSIQGEVSLRQPQELEIDGETLEDNQPQQSEYDPQPEARREFSLRQPQELEINEEMLEHNQPQQNEYDPQPEARREFSLRQPQELEINGETLEDNQSQQSEYDPQPEARREFSLRQPQELNIDEEMMEVNQAQHFQLEPQSIVHQDSPVIDPEPNQMELREQQHQTVFIQEYSLPESTVEDTANDNLGMSLVEQNESIMHLDVFVNVSYFESKKDVQTRQILKHSWQVKIEVEVPTDKPEFAGYGKVSSSVTSTLQRFDNIVLNDVYPFDILEPNTENIAQYFYNCLRDTASMMDVILKEITLWENQTLIMQVNKRNKEFDDLLQRGDDIIQEIRGLFNSRERRKR